MTQEAAIYSFMNSFGIPAYTSTSVPDKAEFPYITYDLAIGEWDSGDTLLVTNVWYRTESEAVPNAKVREIFETIGRSGCTLRCDGGLIWLKRGTPWAQAVNTEGSDEKVKRRYLNIDAEFLTI